MRADTFMLYECNHYLQKQEEKLLFVVEQNKGQD